MYVARKLARNTASLVAIALATAVATPAFAQDAPATATAPGSAESEQDIVVTAQKREQRLLDVASGISVQTGEELDARRAQNMEDLFKGEPGVTYLKTRPDQSFPVIRGINTGSSLNLVTVPVGIYLGDVPVSDPQFPQSVLDLNPVDLDRVEILKGPQGALYGANSLSGAVRYIFKRPDLNEKTGGFFDVSASDVKDADGFGYRASAGLNLTNGNNAGIRLTGWAGRTPGYIDNITAGVEDSNDYTSWGARAVGLLKPSESFTATLIGMYQQSKVSDYSEVTDPDDLSFVGTPTRSPQKFRSIFANLILEYDISDAVSITSNTSYLHKTRNIRLDTTNGGLFCANFLQLFGLPISVPYCQSTDRTTSKQFFQELRLAGQISNSFSFVAGASYQTAKVHIGDRDEFAPSTAPGFFDQIEPFLPFLAPGVTIDQLGPQDAFLYGEAILKNQESAIFGEVQFQVTPSLSLTAGGRYYRNTSELPVQYFNGFYTYLFFNPGSLVYSNTFPKSTEDGFAPKFSALYKIDNRQSVYAAASRGYRFGGVNVVPDIGQTEQSKYKTDTLWSYEIGYRGSPARGLYFDAAAYLMKWDDAQVQVTAADNFQRVRNVGKAEVKGVEVGATIDVARNFTIRAAGAYTDAQTTEDVALSPILTIPSGTRLPGSPKFSGSITGDLRFGGPFGSEGNAIVTYSRTGRFFDEIQHTNRVGGLDLVDARVVFKKGRVEYSVFGTNLTNEQDPAGVSTLYVTRYSVPVPRTIGMGVRFEY